MSWFDFFTRAFDMQRRYDERPDYDYRIRWNMPRNSRRARFKDEKSGDFQHIFGRPRVPRLKPSEEGLVKWDIEETIIRLFDELKIETVDYLGKNLWREEESMAFSGEVSGFFSPFDRSIEIPLMDPQMFPPAMLRGIQQFLIDRYPDWRVALLGNAKRGEPYAVIYSDAIRFGELLCPPQDFETTAREWQAKIEAIRDTRDGAEKRRWFLAKSKVPALAEAARQNGAAFLAAFPTIYEGQPQISVYLLLWRSEYDIDWAPLKCESCGSIETVTATGEVFHGDYKADPWWTMQEINFDLTAPFEFSLTWKSVPKTCRIEIGVEDVVTESGYLLNRG